MRSSLLPLLLAALSLSLSSVPASSAQTVDPHTGAVCEPRSTDVESLRGRAEKGNASAEYELGRSMLRTPTDSEFASAMPWFRRSAEQGYAPAEYLYGSIFREGRWKNPKEVIYWWKKAAEQGNVPAQLWLGAFYEQGRNGIERDYQQAFKWLSKAAEQGQPDAQVALGQMYENGEGVPQNHGMAAYWYRKAADHSHDLGGAGVGVNGLVQLYQDGHATPQDYVFVYLAYARAQDKDGMEEIGRKMSADQIANAQRRAREWMEPQLPCPAAKLPVQSLATFMR
jgi:TPR repeat protein